MKLQKIALAIGQTGCLFCCIKNVARKNKDSMLERDYVTLTSAGILGLDCTVLSHQRIAEFYGLKFVFKGSAEEFNILPTDVVLAHSKNHFVQVDKDGYVVYDPLGAQEGSKVTMGDVRVYR